MFMLASRASDWKSMSTPGELLEALGREARARFGTGGAAPTRVFRGRSVDELVPQIQRELGADAIIVRRREGLTGGMFGFFQRAFVEIEAMPGGPGVDVYDEADSPAPAGPPSQAPIAAVAPALQHPSAPQYQPAPAPAQTSSPQQFAPSAPAPPARFEQSVPAPEQSVPAAEQRPAAGYPPPCAAPATAYPPTQPAGEPQPPPAPPVVPSPPVAPTPFYAREAAAPSAGGGSAYVTAHLAALARADRTKLPPRAPAPTRRGEPPTWSTDFSEPGTAQGLRSADVPELFPAAPARARTPVQRAPVERVAVERAPVQRPPAPPWASSERREVAPGSHSRARAGVARSLQRAGIGEELTRELLDGASAHALALAPRAGLAQAVRVTLAQRIPVAPVLPTEGAAIVVVGAGGAGKTTCCAALLGAYRKSSSLPASFATVTRNPVGAAEPERGELRMILSPYVMKPTPARAPRAVRALRRARGDGVAVLDTPGVSPSDRAGVRELARLLAELAPERVVVALPATLGATAAAQLLQALRPLGANAMAVTHADETDQLGVAVEAACRFGLAPEYMLERARAGGWRLRQISPTALAERLLP
jgi:flagellar biosynthesis GTPase FlhF